LSTQAVALCILPCSAQQNDQVELLLEPVIADLSQWIRSLEKRFEPNYQMSKKYLRSGKTKAM